MCAGAIEQLLSFTASAVVHTVPVAAHVYLHAKLACTALKIHVQISKFAASFKGGNKEEH